MFSRAGNNLIYTQQLPLPIASRKAFSVPTVSLTHLDGRLLSVPVTEVWGRRMHRGWGLSVPRVAGLFCLTVHLSLESRTCFTLQTT